MKLLLLTLLMLSAAHAAKVDLKNLPANTKKGMEMFKIGKVEEAKKLLKPDADAGNSAAQFFLALSLDGNTPAAQAAALTYYKKSSDQGFPAAQMIYGTFLLNGLGGAAKDPQTAKKLFQAIIANPDSAQFPEVIQGAKQMLGTIK